MRYFISAIGTDSGKTLACAMLLEALGADYWKPVQAGTPTDSDTIKSLVSNERTNILPEAFILKTPASPHAAARIDNISLKVADLELPGSEKLIVEGAGGLLVPLNDSETMLDLAAHFDLPVILISDLYLGSINHTLLSCEELKRSGLKVEGIIFNGEPNEESQRIIALKSGFPILFHILPQEVVNATTVQKLAVEFLKKNPSYAGNDRKG